MSTEIEDLTEKIDKMMDNHMAHMQEDITELKTKVEVIDVRLENIEGFLRQNFSRLLIGLIAIAGAAVGIPMSGV